MESLAASMEMQWNHWPPPWRCNRISGRLHGDAMESLAAAMKMHWNHWPPPWRCNGIIGRLHGDEDRGETSDREARVEMTRQNEERFIGIGENGRMDSGQG